MPLALLVFVPGLAVINFLGTLIDVNWAPTINTFLLIVLALIGVYQGWQASKHSRQLDQVKENTEQVKADTKQVKTDTEQVKIRTDRRSQPRLKGERK